MAQFLQQSIFVFEVLPKIRCFSTKPILKTPKKKYKSNLEKIHQSEQIFELHGSAERSELLKIFPIKLLRKKQKTPESLYLVNEKSANIISEHLLNNLPPNIPIVEVNPGPGLLTNRLLQNKDLRKLLIFEYYDEFMPLLKKLQDQDPDRLTVKRADFVNLWKLTFRDRLDNGTRFQDVLIDLPKKHYTDDINARIIAGIGSYNFFKHLVNSLAFQNGILSLGRSEMYLIVPPPVYIHLTCTNDAGYLIYRATSMLFQIMFEHKFIAKLPRENFLPWQNEYDISKSSKLTKINIIDPEYLYLIKIVPRRNLYELCPIEDMPALWFFTKQNCISRKNRIIPNLEKWIPGCGPRLIINQNTAKQIKYLYSDEDISNLPQYSSRCTSMSNQDYLKSINIFTQFGDLTPSQMLTLFTEFRAWPEYKESPFLASLENCLLKMEQASDDNVDGLEINEEDDITVSEENFDLKEKKLKSNK